MRLYPLVKRAFDLVLLLATSIFWLPLLAALAALVRIQMGPGIFFRQPRAGKHGRTFVLLKFRTMTEQRDGEGVPLPDEKRVTPFGRWLRSTSLDELPEFLNILKGDMSLVGPRPLLVPYLKRYTPEQHRRHLALPGLTGWAQVNGRNGATWDERLSLDVWYVDHLSFWLDVKILWATLKLVWLQEGVNAPGRIGMEEFRGVQPGGPPDTSGLLTGSPSQSEKGLKE